LQFRRPLSSATAFNRSRRSILGQAEDRNPKEVGSEARLSRRGNKQRKSEYKSTASVEGESPEETGSYVAGLAVDAAFDGSRGLRFSVWTGDAITGVVGSSIESLAAGAAFD